MPALLEVLTRTLSFRARRVGKGFGCPLARRFSHLDPYETCRAGCYPKCRVTTEVRYALKCHDPSDTRVCSIHADGLIDDIQVSHEGISQPMGLLGSAAMIRHPGTLHLQSAPPTSNYRSRKTPMATSGFS